MIFSSIYFYLELNQFDQGYDNGSLSITVRRKNSSYFNQEGINIVVEEYIDGAWVNTNHVYVWYTEYNPTETAQQPVFVYGSGTPISVTADTFEGLVSYTGINNKTIFNGKRLGKKMIRVLLLRNNTNELFVVGEFDITTLEIALPTIHDFEATTLGKSINLYFKGVNPLNFNSEVEERLYKLKISSTLSATPILIDSDQQEAEFLLPILREYYEKKIFEDGLDTGQFKTKTKTERIVNFYAEWYIPAVIEQQIINEGDDDEIITDVIIEPEISMIKKQYVYRVPNFALGLSIQTEAGPKKIEAMYQKVNGQWRKVAKVYQKIGGSFLSQD